MKHVYLTTEDHLIYRRVTGVMTQGRYLMADRADANFMAMLVRTKAQRTDQRGNHRVLAYHGS
jgi:hypothetical protein